MLESEIIRNCAATLAGIKTGSLFNFRYEEEEILRNELCRVNDAINSKGVFAVCLKRKDHHALIYLYRESSLRRDLAVLGVQELLKDYGYRDFLIGPALETLKKRLGECSCFPHEIGVFLGYPTEDVAGFIKHKGKDCKCCGLWKVYCNENETKKLFEKIAKCSRVYSEIFAEGRNICQMTVSA